MSKLNKRNAIAGIVFLFVLNSCSSYYESYGYGWVKKSPLPEEMVTRVVLPEGAPSISQRYQPLQSPSDGRPVKLPSTGGHLGFDLLVPSRTPVLAASDGVVAEVEFSIIYGRQIVVNHGKIVAGFRIQTRYFHLTEQIVKPDEKLRRGQLLGYSGASGLAGMYPHLHFEVHRLNDSIPAVAIKFLDPQKFWVGGVGMITCYDSQREFPADPVTLTYPVPCQGIDWQ